MTLFEKIMVLHPSLTPQDFNIGGTIVLQNDGKGDYIAKWEHPNFPKPTAEELA